MLETLKQLVCHAVPCCPYKLIPGKMHTYQTRKWDNMAAYQCRAETFKSSGIPWTISKWNKIYLAIRYSTYSKFRSHLHKECQSALTLLYIHKPKGDKLRSRLRLGFTGLGKLGFLEHRSLLLKATSREPCMPRNFVLLVTFGDTHVPLIVCLFVYKMK